MAGIIAGAGISGIAGALAKKSQTGYQDSTNNSVVRPAIPQGMQDFMGVGMQRLNDKIMADRQTQAQRAAANAGNASGNSIVGAAAGVAGAAPVSIGSSEASSAGTSALEARIAALESAGSNMPSAPSSMAPHAIATGEAMFGNQEQRNNSINPFNSALI